jgi:predicted glycosyltransferase
VRGGADGSSLIEKFLHAAGPLRRQLGGTWLAISGPLMPYDEHLRLVRIAERHDIELRRVVPELRAHLAIADCVVAMPGYNTVCDVLSFQRPAIFMPRQSPSHEQMLRARRLDEWGSAQVLLEPNPELLRAALVRALNEPVPPATTVPLDGAERAIDVFDRTLQRLAVH